MGTSQSISDLSQQDQSFTNYLATTMANLNSLAQPYQAQFNTEIEAFYSKNNWDQQPQANGSYTDSRQASEFSLDSLNQTVSSIANALFAGAAVPAGTTLVGKNIIQTALDAGYQALALAAATAFIQNILGAFTTDITTNFYSTFKSQSLAPGLTLHVWQYGDAFQNQNYFNNQYIVQTVVSFQLIYSFAQQQSEQNMEFMNSYQTDIEGLESSISKLQSLYDKWIADPRIPIDQANRLQQRITALQANLQGYQGAVAAKVQAAATPSATGTPSTTDAPSTGAPSMPASSTAGASQT